MYVFICAKESKTVWGILVYTGLVKERVLREKEGRNDLGRKICLKTLGGNQDNWGQGKW